MSNKRKLIGSHIKIAYENLHTVQKLGLEDRNTSMILFYAAENLVMAALTAEDLDRSDFRHIAGNHQLDRMVDLLPDECHLKEKLSEVAVLTAYSTTFRYPGPSGSMPNSPAPEKVEAWFRSMIELTQAFTKHFLVNVKKDDPKAATSRPIREEHELEPSCPAP